MPTLNDGSRSRQILASINNGDSNSISSDEMIAMKRSFTHKLALRRQIYHEMTSIKKFPLQEMAIRDVEEKLKDYLSASDAAGSDSEDSSDCTKNQRQRQVVVATAIASPSSSQMSEEEGKLLREQFTQEFLREKSKPVVIMPEIDQSGINNADGGGVPTLTQEIEIFLPIIDAAVERHFGGCETDRNGTSVGSNSSRTECDSENIVEGGNSIFIVEEEEEKVTESQHLPTLWSFEPRLFAMETALRGKRRYVSAHLGRFMDHYWRECDVHSRHYYELIREDTPCRLYFDLEFNKQYNPRLTKSLTESLLTELFDEICHQFELLYSISVERSDMVDLDSSTAKKFSRHWILHIPGGVLFDDARAAGIFVKMMVARLEKEIKSGGLASKGRAVLAKHLFVNAEEATDEKVDPKMTCIIDLGVYTRNRLFRLLGSKKFGKTCDATLRIAETNEFSFPRQFITSVKTMGVESCSTADLQDVGGEDASFQKFCNSMCFEAHAEALASTLVVPSNGGKIKFPTLPHPVGFLTEDERAKLSITPRSGGFEGITNAHRGSPEYGESPFPKLDHFIINTLGKRKSLDGSIGTWTLDYMLQPLPQLISYNMRGNRYCDNIGRAHKSNNIIWNVHLVDRICFQTCHDPDCRASKFRGKSLDLSEEVNAEIDEYFLEHELSKLNEDLVIRSNTNNVDKETATRKAFDEFDDPDLEQAMAMLQLNIERKKPNDEANEGDAVPLAASTVESEDAWDDDNELDSELLKVAEKLPEVFS